MLALAAAALRAHDLAGQSLWSDEDITLDRARLPLSEMLAALPVEHGPLYFASMRGWTLLAGESDLALRWPSLLAGVVAVPLLFVLGRRLIGANAGWVAALLATVNPFLVAYGQEARMYALLLALAAGAFVAAAVGDRSQGQAVRGSDGTEVAPGSSLGRTEDGRDEFDRAGVGRSIACGALMALAVYTHYYGALAVAALGAWALHDLLAAWRQTSRAGMGSTDGMPLRAAARDWSITFSTAGLLFLPWLPRALRVLEHPGWREAADLGQAPWQLAAAWSAQTGVTAMQPTTGLESAATVLYCVLALLGLVALLRRRALRALLLAATPTLLATLLLVRNPDFHPRYYFAVLPAWLLLVAAGAAGTDGRARALAGTVAGSDDPVGAGAWSATIGSWCMALLLVLATLPGLGRHYTDPTARKQDYRHLLATVEAQSPAAESVLLLDGPSMGLAKRYLAPDSDLKLENLRSGTNRERLDEGRDVFDARLAELAERRPHVWLASNGGGEGLADGWLAEHLYPVRQLALLDTALARYYAPPDEVAQYLYPRAPGYFCLPEALPDQAMLCLGAHERTLRRVDAGEVLPFRLVWLPGGRWADTAPANSAHHVSIRLIDEEGEPTLSIDRAPVDGTMPTNVWSSGSPVVDQHGLWIPPDTPTKTYEARVRLYDALDLTPFHEWWIGGVQITDGSDR